jgi:cleavage and polyadenylation specificity factor subunit 1
MVERFHRQLKSAIRCHNTKKWVGVLPTTLMGFRSALKEDIQATPAEPVYGEPLRLPGEFLSPISGPTPMPPISSTNSENTFEA